MDTVHNLQTVFSFLSGTLLPLLDLQEDSREVGAVFHILVQQARRESVATLEELANFLQPDMPQTATVLRSYAIDTDTSKEGRLSGWHGHLCNSIIFIAFW